MVPSFSRLSNFKLTCLPLLFHLSFPLSTLLCQLFIFTLLLCRHYKYHNTWFIHPSFFTFSSFSSSSPSSSSTPKSWTTQTYNKHNAHPLLILHLVLFLTSPLPPLLIFLPQQLKNRLSCMIHTFLSFLTISSSSDSLSPESAQEKSDTHIIHTCMEVFTSLVCDVYFFCAHEEKWLSNTFSHFSVWHLEVLHVHEQLIHSSIWCN